MNNGIGDNQPKDPLAIYLDDMSEAAKEPLAKLNKLRLEQATRIPLQFTTEDQALKGISLALILKDLLDTVELIVANNRKPLNDMTKLMLANKQAWLLQAEEFYGAVRERINAFMDTMPPGRQLRTGYGELATRREHFKFEIVDEDHVPRELCSPDGGAIKAWIKAKMEDAEGPENANARLAELNEAVPAIRVYRDPQLVLTDGGKT